MNMEEVRNPHRIYPGQQLVLDKIGRTRPPARTRPAAASAGDHPGVAAHARRIAGRHGACRR